MQSLIKRNNFSPEDRKILNKIDKHIKELEEKVEEGGGGGETDNVGMEVYDLNIELPEEYVSIFLTGQNKGIGLPPLQPIMIQEELPSNSFVNVYVNGTKLYSGISISFLYMGMEIVSIYIPEVNVLDTTRMIAKHIQPTILVISIVGQGTLINAITPYDSTATVELNGDIIQDELNLKFAYDNCFEETCHLSIFCSIKHLNRTQVRKITFVTNHALNGDIAEFTSIDREMTLGIDSTGSIKSFSYMSMPYVASIDLINALDERIKALENGN